MTDQASPKTNWPRAPALAAQKHDPDALRRAIATVGCAAAMSDLTVDLARPFSDDTEFKA